MRINNLTHEVLLTEDEYHRLVKEEPASEELEEAANNYADKHGYRKYELTNYVFFYKNIKWE